MGEMIVRRGLLRGLGVILAAPAIVRASSLMAISPLPTIDDILAEWPFNKRFLVYERFPDWRWIDTINAINHSILDAVAFTDA